MFLEKKSPPKWILLLDLFASIASLVSLIAIGVALFLFQIQYVPWMIIPSAFFGASGAVIRSYLTLYQG